METLLSTLQDFSDYIAYGFAHIIPGGLDHIFFIVGIFLTATGLRHLVLQASLFTLAHSLTLILASIGWVYAPENVVEPLIALSIAALGAEAILTRNSTIKRTSMHPKFSLHTSLRLMMIFAFGLLHGMGFAGPFIDSGLSGSTLIVMVIGFNVGVEISQISLLLGLWLLLSKSGLDDHAGTHKYIRLPVAIGLTIIGLYWTVSRVMAAV